MFGWFRRKPGFAEFAAPFRARTIRRSMKAANPKILAAIGFERTLTERTKPVFGAEIAESQSLKSARKAMRAAARAQHSFKGGRK